MKALARFSDQRARKTSFSQGSFLLEPLISVTIFSIFIVFFLGTFRNIFASQDIIWERMQASLLAQDAVESVYNWLMNSDWQSAVNIISENEIYAITPGQAPVPVFAAEVINNKYAREITLRPAYRNQETFQLVNSPGSGTMVDNNLIVVIATVEWQYRGKMVTTQFSTYVSNPESE